MRRRLTPSSRVAWLLPTISAAALLACNPPKLDQDGDGFTELTGDCDDLDANIHPDAPEVCGNDIDDNCNGVEDEEGATSGRVWYVDLDGDGYGQAEITVDACDQPEGYAAEKWDCDDTNPDLNPAAAEMCDYIDNDCDGEIDETTSGDAPTWYPDGDGDGYGDTERAVVGCEPPGDGWINEGSDCSDGDPLVSPEQTESCITPYDDDCDGTANTEGAFGCTLFYADRDGDGHAGSSACLCEAEAPYTASEATDCDDNDGSVYPGSGTVDTAWSDKDCDGIVVKALEDADHRIASDTKENTNSRFVFPYRAGAGDTDGDGLQDAVITLYGSSSYVRERAVVVVTGADLMGVTSLLDDPTARLDGSESSPNLGEGVIRAVGQHPPHLSDLNEDGFDDLVVTQQVGDGATYYSEVAVFLGPVSGTLSLDGADSAVLFEQGDQNLYPAGLGGDDRDGHPLLAIGNPNAVTGIDELATGVVSYIGWDDSTGALVAAGEQEGLVEYQRFGVAVEPVGDLTGDGLEDRIITTDTIHTSTYGQTSSGKGVLEVFEEVDGFPVSTIVSNRVYRGIGGITGAGDLNGDGHIDLTIASPSSDMHQVDAGRVHVLWGPIPRSVSELVDLDQLVFYGPVPGAMLQGSVVPDVDGDGRDDLFLGATMENPQGELGTTLLWFGEDLHGYTFAGDGMVQFGNEAPEGAYLEGNSPLLGPGDMDGDGRGDLLLRGFSAGPDNPTANESLFFFSGGAR